MWWMYVVCCADDTLYTGVTTHLGRRLREHNGSKRGAKYTKTRRPVVLVYEETHDSRSSAQRAEGQFKKLSRQQKLRRIEEGGVLVSKKKWTCVHCKTGIVQRLPSRCPECDKFLNEEVIKNKRGSK